MTRAWQMMALVGAAWAAGAVWAAPPCAGIQGAPSVTVTRDRGATLAPTAGQMAGISYTQGLLAMPRRGLLYATVGARVLRSTDDGCNWSSWLDLRRATGDALLTLTAAGAEDFYAWSDNGDRVTAVFGGVSTTVAAPGVAVVGLAVMPGQPHALRVADAQGVIWESADVGAHWRERGRVPQPVWAYRGAFSPQDPDHVVVGTMGEGAWASHDGGVTWARAAGLGKAGESVNVFNAVFSPARASRVWAMGLNMAELDAGAPSQGRHIYRSDDGGLTFAPVVDHDDARITLTNGPLLAPHPTLPGVLYFVFGTFYQGYGTDLYRYSEATRAVTATHNAYDEIGAIAFHPRRPRVMYLGLNNEGGAAAR